MQFNKNTSSGKTNFIGLIIKSILGITVFVCLLLFLNTIEFPTPIKKIEKIIPNEKFKIVK